MSKSPISSDITLDASKFSAASITENTLNLNKIIENTTRNGVKWYIIGAQKWRELSEAGKLATPPPVYLPDAREISIPSREPGRSIPMRLFAPENGQPSKAIMLHIHGGGMVLGGHRFSDARLKEHANKCQMTVVSVGYRLAPENPFPAGPEDCFDAAEYLVDHGEKEFGAKLGFIKGESAGGNLTALTAFHLLRNRPNHVLQGLIMAYGWFDLSGTLPQASTFDRPLIIDLEQIRQYASAYVPGWTTDQRKNPALSPLRDDLQWLAANSVTGKLPPALFMTGTEDALMDDTLLMGMKWLTTGSEAVIKVYPGGSHGYTLIPGLQIAEESNDTLVQWIQQKLA